MNMCSYFIKTEFVYCFDPSAGFLWEDVQSFWPNDTNLILIDREILINFKAIFSEAFALVFDVLTVFEIIQIGFKDTRTSNWAA